MESRKKMKSAISLIAALLFLVVMVDDVAAVRYTVGDRGWAPNAAVNYTVWAEAHHFYNGDWLYFVYDRNQQNVLEVNQTNYETCNSNSFLHNWTRGAGRDVVPLNVTKTYYFISGNGFCYSGMKVAIHVEHTPPPPSASPVRSASPKMLSNFRGQVILPALFAIASMWDSIMMFL